MSFICTSCRHALNAAGRRWYSAVSERPPRVAIIGSGPAGFYSAHRLQQRLDGVKVDMFERLPTPFGLVRFGVAPDHPEVKNCIDTFNAVADSPAFNYVGNVKVGEAAGELPLSLLAPHYDALLFAYGASEDRQMGVPGEALHGVHSARAFVGWYNGLPEFADLDPDLQSGENAIVIGQGNVAMDVARILLSPLHKLRQTDITEQALDALSKSTIQNVKIVGRRGPLQAAFTTKELRELINLENVHFDMNFRSLLPDNLKGLPRTLRRSAELMLKGSSAAQQGSPRSWSLEFLLNPSGMSAAGHSHKVSRVDFEQMEMENSPGEQATMSPDQARQCRSRPAANGSITSFDAGLVFKSVGYKSEPIPGSQQLGITFDTRRGIVPNDASGRIIDAGQGVERQVAIPGMYTAGWVKRGPTGVIATTMDDAFVSADAIHMDWELKAPFLGARGEEKHGWEAIRPEAEARGIRGISWTDWKAIDAEERRRGAKKGKDREKCRSVDDMLAILDN